MHREQMMKPTATVNGSTAAIVGMQNETQKSGLFQNLYLRYGLAGGLSAFSTHAALVPLDVSYYCLSKSPIFNLLTRWSKLVFRLTHNAITREWYQLLKQ